MGRRLWGRRAYTVRAGVDGEGIERGESGELERLEYARSKGYIPSHLNIHLSIQICRFGSVRPANVTQTSSAAPANVMARRAGMLASRVELCGSLNSYISGGWTMN